MEVSSAILNSNFSHTSHIHYKIYLLYNGAFAVRAAIRELVELPRYLHRYTNHNWLTQCVQQFVLFYPAITHHVMFPHLLNNLSRTGSRNA